MSQNLNNITTGWLRDYPDQRDYNPDHKEIKSFMSKLNIGVSADDKKAKSSSLPTKIDLSQWFSPIEDQKNIGSCTATMD